MSLRYTHDYYTLDIISLQAVILCILGSLQPSYRYYKVLVWTHTDTLFLISHWNILPWRQSWQEFIVGNRSLRELRLFCDTVVFSFMYSSMQKKYTVKVVHGGEQGR